MKRNSILIIALIAVIVIVGAAAYWMGNGQATTGNASEAQNWHFTIMDPHGYFHLQF